jgi:hypothetical protein
MGARVYVVGRGLAFAVGVWRVGEGDQGVWSALGA